jgi:hypothetical protein
MLLHFRIINLKPFSLSWTALFADGATASLVAMLHTHFESSEEVSLATRTISLLVKSGHCRKQLSQFRTSACCCAIVQSICVHCRCEEHCSQVPEASILILKYLLQCMCDLMDLDTAPPDKLLRHRALLVKEGAHEAVVLLLKALKISGDALDPHFSSTCSVRTLLSNTAPPTLPYPDLSKLESDSLHYS